MKKLILIASLLSLAAMTFGFLRHAGQPARGSASRLTAACSESFNQLAAMEAERQSLLHRRRELKVGQAQAQREPRIARPLADWLLSDSGDRVPDELAPRLREALGLTWDASDDFVWVSKQSLRLLQVPALQTNAQLTEAVSALLAITPEERVGVETAIRDAATANAAWSKEHLRRETPAGDVLAQYVIPADFRQQLTISNAIFGSLVTAVGSERGTLFLHHAANGLQREIGLSPNLQTTLIVRRPASTGSAELTFELIREVSEQSLPVRGPQAGEVLGNDPDRDRQRLGEIRAYQTTIPGLTFKGMAESCRGAVTPESFPRGLLPVFPGGWNEIARSEGFELPTK